MARNLITVEQAPSPETDKRLVEFYGYWQGLRQGGNIPYRKDFSPAAIPSLLPFVVLVDVLDNPRDFRFRLTGSAFYQAVGQELTGQLIGDVFPPDFGSEVFAGWNAIVENGGPNWARGSLWREERDFLDWQGVLLPLQAADGTINQLVGAAAFNVRTPSRPTTR